jgi:hypothetical protein
MPTPSTVPASPMDDPEAIRQRQIASDSAISEAKATGRGSTIVAGGVMARSAQYARSRARSAAAADLGL